MSLKAASEAVEDRWAGRKDFEVEFCQCQVGDHAWLKQGLDEAQGEVLEGLDDPGDLRDSYDYKRYTSLLAAVTAHIQSDHGLLLARDGEVLLGAVSFMANFTYNWMEEPEKLLTRKGLLEITNLGTTGAIQGVGRELCEWLGAVAHLRGQEVGVFADEGSEGFYEKLGLSPFSPGLAAARYLWRLEDLPVLETQEIVMGSSGPTN